MKPTETTQHTSRHSRAFINRHAVLIFIAMVFALTLGPWGLALITASPGAAPGTGDELTATSPLMLVAYLVGTASPALAGILVIAIASGRVGLRDLRSRLLQWRVDVRWYAVALLTVPLLEATILFAFSLTTPAFLPAIITAEDKANLLVAGLVGGLMVGLVISFLEEIGWTGLATHELRKRHGMLATGLILGLPWTVMHLPAYAASGAVPPALEMAVIFFYFVPYRMLMVWVYDRTQSVLIAMLMHLPLIIFVYGLVLPPAMPGVPALIFNLVFGAALWVFVAAIAVANHRKRRIRLVRR